MLHSISPTWLFSGWFAAVALAVTSFAIGVVEPFMSGVGGVAAMVCHDAKPGKTVVVDGSSTAPQAARARGEQLQLQC